MNWKLYFAVLLTSAVGESGHAAVFEFGSSRNGLVDVANGAITVDGFTLRLSAGPQGALLNESGQSGLGVNSRGLPTVEPVDDGGGAGSPIELNLIGGTSPFAGVAESITFSFDQPGILTELNFDGVKDESYEHVIFQTLTSPDIYFFDSFENSNADPDLIHVPGVVVFLQEGNSAIDDRSPPLSIQFSAGQTFLLTYGDLPLGDAGNGLRWQGVTVTAIPEPGSVALTLILGACLARYGWRRCGTFAA